MLPKQVSREEDPYGLQHKPQELGFRVAVIKWIGMNVMTNKSSVTLPYRALRFMFWDTFQQLCMRKKKKKKGYAAHSTDQTLKR